VSTYEAHYADGSVELVSAMDISDARRRAREIYPDAEVARLVIVEAEDDDDEDEEEEEDEDDQDAEEDE
jgi:hypothetical protein